MADLLHAIFLHAFDGLPERCYDLLAFPAYSEELVERW